METRSFLSLVSPMKFPDTVAQNSHLQLNVHKKHECQSVSLFWSGRNMEMVTSALQGKDCLCRYENRKLGGEFFIKVFLLIQADLAN